MMPQCFIADAAVAKATKNTTKPMEPQWMRDKDSARVTSGLTVQQTTPDQLRRDEAGVHPRARAKRPSADRNAQVGGGSLLTSVELEETLTRLRALAYRHGRGGDHAVPLSWSQRPEVYRNRSGFSFKGLERTRVKKKKKKKGKWQK